MLYKILDECKINEHNKEYFFRVPYIVDLGYKTLKKDLLGNVVKSKRGYEIGIKGNKENIYVNYIR